MKALSAESMARREQLIIRREHGPSFSPILVSAPAEKQFLLVCPLQVRARAYGLQFPALFASKKLFVLAVLEDS